MAKFSGLQTAAPPPPKAAIKTKSAKPDTHTAEGAPGYTRKAKSELFLLAVTNMVSENTFYEKAKNRDERFEGLITDIAARDPDWLARLVPYLRDTMNLRSASIVLAAITVHEKLALRASRGAGLTAKPSEVSQIIGTISNRSIIASALQRADEPAELVAYWRNRWGRALPKPVRRGVADAIGRLYNERAFLRYGHKPGLQMADVVDIIHPKPVAPWQSALFKHLLNDKHGHVSEIDPLLSRITARQALDALAPEARTADKLDSEGAASWEWASAWYGRTLDAAYWQALIPEMGYMALLRNLRNFDDAKIDDAAAGIVINKLIDADEVARSRQLPLRFYSAWKHTGSMRWAQPLETALQLSLRNVPILTGRTLIMVDTSGSMKDPLSKDSKIARWDVAALFGAALAVRAEKANLVTYHTDSREHPVTPGGSILRAVDELLTHKDGGTNTWQALAAHYAGHDRIVIITDEQAHFGVPIKVDVPVYTFNLAGYKAGHLPSGGKNYTFGGLSDAAFTALALLERREDAPWPF